MQYLNTFLLGMGCCFLYAFGAAPTTHTFEAAIQNQYTPILYTGTNPITIIASEIPAHELEIRVWLKADEAGYVHGSHPMLQHIEGHQYQLTCHQAGEVYISLYHPKTKKSINYNYWVVPLPNPQLVIDGKEGGEIDSVSFRESHFLQLKMENPTLNKLCNLISYNLYYTPLNQDPVEMKGNKEDLREGTIGRVIQRAKAGDQYVFTNIKVRCQGDKKIRYIDGLVFKIK